MRLTGSGTQAQQLRLTGSGTQAQQLWRTGLVAQQHVESSWTRDRTSVPCIGRQILIHWATRDIFLLCLKLQKLNPRPVALKLQLHQNHGRGLVRVQIAQLEFLTQQV